jgi:hypothetical protein
MCEFNFWVNLGLVKHLVIPADIGIDQPGVPAIIIHTAALFLLLRTERAASNPHPLMLGRPSFNHPKQAPGVDGHHSSTPFTNRQPGFPD